MDALAKVCPKCGRRYDSAAAFCQTDGVRLQLAEDQAPDPYIGQVLLDQFEIQEKIGAGGMGSVYRARQTTLHRDVAIKILHPELADHRDAVRRFKREARVCTALDHPNLVRVFLFGQLPDGSLYIVMEHLQGRSLLGVLQREGALPVHRALHIATQICDGIGEAHAHGVVHRDVKPENVILVTRAREPDFVKVLDFGIARVLSGENQTVATQSGLVFGTARYISPEGAAGEATDVRSDVYSLGVLTYQLLTGRTPFDAASPVQMLMKHIHADPPHVKAQPRGQHVPDAVADVVMRALAKNPEGRFEDAHVLGEALRGAAERAGFIVGRRNRGSIDPSGEIALEQPDPPGLVAERSARHAYVQAEPEPTPRMSLTAPPDSSTLAAAPSPFAEDTGYRLPGVRVRSGGVLKTVGIAFVVGALMVGGVVGVDAWLDSRPTAPTVNVDDLVTRAREAMGRGDYDRPAEESVAGYTARILAERPGHEAALELRAEAARRLRMAADELARDEDRDEALATYRRAHVLAPDDAEIAAAIHALEHPPPPPLAPGVRTRPAQVFAGSEVALVAVLEEDLAVGDRGEPRFVVQRARRQVEGNLEATLGEDAAWTAPYTFRRSGPHEVIFRLGRGESVIERRATIEVAPDPAVRARVEPGDEEDPPPVTTQGSSWTAPVIAPAWSPTPMPPSPQPDPDPGLPPPPAPWNSSGSIL